MLDMAGQIHKNKLNIVSLFIDCKLNFKFIYIYMCETIVDDVNVYFTSVIKPYSLRYPLCFRSVIHVVYLINIYSTVVSRFLNLHV